MSDIENMDLQDFNFDRVVFQIYWHHILFIQPLKGPVYNPLADSFIG